MVLSKHALEGTDKPSTASESPPCHSPPCANTSRDKMLRGKGGDRPLGRAARREEGEEGMGEVSEDGGADEGSWSQPGKAWGWYLER